MSKKLTMIEACELYNQAMSCLERLRSKPEILARAKATITRWDTERVTKLIRASRQVPVAAPGSVSDADVAEASGKGQGDV